MGQTASKEDVEQVEETWRQILWAEELFWPAIDP